MGIEKLPMNLQLFADGVSSAQETNPDTNSGSSNNDTAGTSVVVDYQKIQQMLDGTLAAKEKTALSAFFKQQGLSQEEVEKAIQTFKEEKSKNQPDISKLQNDLATANELVRKAQVENKAILMASSLGVDLKIMPYLMKMADLSKAIDDKGVINEEEIKNAINKVLSDVPGLKTGAGDKGFIQVGAGATNNNNNSTDNALRKAFGLVERNN